VSLLHKTKLFLRLAKGKPPSGEGGSFSYLETSRLVAALIFVITVTSIVLISYEGVGTAHLPVLPGQIASVSVHASLPFSFRSKEQTQLLREQVKNRVPPVYRLEFAPFNRFELQIRGLLDRLKVYEHDFPKDTPSFASRKQALAAIVDNFNDKGPYRASYDDVEMLLSAGDADYRQLLVDRSLVVLREIYNEGTQDQTMAGQNSLPGQVTVYQIAKDDGEIVQRPVQTLEESMIFLRVNLTAEGTSRELSLALFRLFRNGLVPNLIFDQVATAKREAEAVKSLRPVKVNVERGQVIIEQGTRVTPEQYEMLVAHRQNLDERGETAMDEGLQLLGRILMVLAMVAACAMYIKIEDPETLQRNGRLTLLALVVIINLLIVRLTFSLLSFDFFINDATWASTLPFLAPTALAPLIVAILIDTGSAIFVALFISLFTGIIYGNRIDVQVITFLSGIVAVYSCRTTRSRSRVVRAALASGLVVSFTTLILGLVGQTPFDALGKQIAGGLITGLVTGVIVVGSLPMLEMLFRRTTDITLLELTDYNHPLLRLMQMEAPGTYHHSLVVAQLAENAAALIGANPLLARVCALYHDIGKTKNPYYFNENQSDGHNPHDSISPERSAEIIRQHVFDGLELARKHRLPRAVIDCIEQHHGTTLIRFFFIRARQLCPEVEIDEAKYRYSGPRPNSRESALIALADSVEAAARSLKKSTPEELETLIEAIVRERIDDAQLDEAPLTLAEIGKAKQSFLFTLTNMLHGRVAYPKL
jgi:putative nucleotidyltransferase with HDIG domain